MPQRNLFQTVVERLGLRQGEMKVNGDVKGFVPSDRVVRYLAEVQRRRGEGLKPRASAP